MSETLIDALKKTYFDTDLLDFSKCRLSYACTFWMSKSEICNPNTCEGETRSIKNCRTTIRQLIKNNKLVENIKGGWKFASSVEKFS